MDAKGQQLQWGKRYHEPAMRIFLFVLVVVAANYSRLVDAITHPGDVQALQEVKSALNASSTTCMGSWDFAFDPCDFTYWIECSAPNTFNISRVTGLRLSGHTGPLSPAIGNLSALHHLILSRNAFHGHIPATLGNLRHLSHLDLSMNSFTGRLPASLGLLSRLTFFSVASNHLTGPIPSSFNRMRSLTFLYLDNNHFEGSIPSLKEIPSLLHLNLSKNALTGALPALPCSISLLAIRSNHLTGHLPPSLKNLTLLQALDLGENRLSGTVSSFLYSLPNLHTLNLSRNEFTAMENFSPKEKTALVSVDFSFNHIVGSLPAAMERLRVVALRSNRFTGGIPHSYALKAASSSEELRELYLDDNYLSGEIPRPLLNLSADVFSANLVRNCLQSCPDSLFFCKGGAQRSPQECKVPVA